jgi:hypothetical protein
MPQSVQRQGRVQSVPKVIPAGKRHAVRSDDQGRTLCGIKDRDLMVLGPFNDRPGGPSLGNCPVCERATK